MIGKVLCQFWVFDSKSSHLHRPLTHNHSLSPTALMLAWNLKMSPKFKVDGAIQDGRGIQTCRI